MPDLMYSSPTYEGERSLTEWARFAIEKGLLLVRHVEREPVGDEERQAAVLVVKGRVVKCRTHHQFKTFTWSEVKEKVEGPLLELRPS